MGRRLELKDLLEERRKDCDILWASRSMDPLTPHKLPYATKYSRKKEMEAVLNDVSVAQTIKALAAMKRVDESVIRKQAWLMVNEMASKARLATVRWIGILITKVLKRIFLSIYINESTLDNLKKEMQISQVQYVYAPSHRSYLDFILLSYILFSYDMALPNIASGTDFYQMHIVGELLRKTGAFYMRRSFSDDLLYKKVFRAYVMSLVTRNERAIEFFIEGTRSRSLKSIVPKYGLLSIILESLLEGQVPDIQFIPISISYERPLEELLFAYELLGIPKPKESTLGLLKSLSILQKPFAYGSVFFNIGEPISAHRFLSMEHRKARALSPFAKLPTNAIEDLAYSIIDSHKKNTVLMPFNLIALLFNQRTQTHPDDPYTLDSLAEDYLWCNDLLRTVSNAQIHTTMKDSTSLGKNRLEGAKLEILEALKPHHELLVLDEANKLVLKGRHAETKNQKSPNVKGHALSEQTMRIAVSSVNLVIYLNPTLSFIVKPAMAVVAIGMEEVHLETAFLRYALLRQLLSTEFAMPLKMDKSVLRPEWDETLKLLLEQQCVHLQNGICVPGENTKFFFLLYNVILPFIDAINVTCSTLFEWDESSSGHPTLNRILVECQRRTEEAFLDGRGCGQHPFCLCLDLFNSTVSNLIAQGILVSYGGKNSYCADKIRLASILSRLDSLRLERPRGSYLSLALLLPTMPALTVQAKL